MEQLAKEPEPIHQYLGANSVSIPAPLLAVAWHREERCHVYEVSCPCSDTNGSSCLSQQRDLHRMTFLSWCCVRTSVKVAISAIWDFSFQV